jgi:hypothetical protein
VRHSSIPAPTSTGPPRLALAIGQSNGDLRFAAVKHNGGLGRRTVVASYVAKVF